VTSPRPPAWIALLRGINVGGRNPVPMDDLRALCAGLGWTEARSYIQSGNLVFRARDGAGELETRLEEAVERRFGLAIPVLVRTAAEWRGYVESNPFPEVAASAPGLLMLALSREPPLAGAAEALRERAADGERIAEAGGALWIHYAGGAGRSRISPGLLDRVVGSAVTTRNWRTVEALAAMAEAMP
jgi:uncharacterized protein (DUF1697 family)